MNPRFIAGTVVCLLAAGFFVGRSVADDEAPPSDSTAASEPQPANTKYVKVTSPLHAYEYAWLKVSELPDHEVEAQFDANKVSLDEVGHGGPENGRRKLLRDIGGHGVAPSSLPLLNELGSQGWELLSEQSDDRTTLYTFKRQLH